MPTVDEEPRRRQILETAVGVFARFGFRKTSMDEVARAADVSRQGLYLYFSSKEELFRAAIGYALDSALRSAVASLGNASLSLEARLVRGFDEWLGRYVGMTTAGASDLVEASKALLGTVIAEQEERFVDAVAKTLRSSGLMPAYRSSGLTARQLADTLNATARGLKHSSASRADFVEGMTVAVRAMCAPLGLH